MVEFRCYKVKLVTTNASKDTVCRKDGKYLSVEDGTAYFCTDDPRLIYDAFGVENVLSTENLGVCYRGISGVDGPAKT